MQGNIKKLQIVQNRAARVALTCGFRTNVNKMHEKLLWLDVNNRLKYMLMVFMRSVITTKRPMICYEKLSFSAGIHKYGTRHAAGGCFTLPKFNTAGQRTVMFRAMKEWNSLPDYITQQKNITNFKEKISPKQKTLLTTSSESVSSSFGCNDISRNRQI